MTFKKSIFSFLASANAIDLQSQTGTELGFDPWGILDGVGTVVGGGVDTVESIVTGDLGGVGDGLLTVGGGALDIAVGGLEGIYSVGAGALDLGVAGVDYVVSGDLIYDINYIFSADFGEDLLSAGEFVFTGDLFIEGYDWASDGGNWALTASSMLGVAGDIVTGDWTGALDTITDPGSYDVSIRTDQEIRKAYDDYVANYNENVLPLKEEYDAAVAKKTENCGADKPAVGSQIYPMYGSMWNYT